MKTTAVMLIGAACLVLLPGIAMAERMAVTEALSHATAAGAWAAFAEERLGRIAPGFLADAVVLGDDPTAVPPEAIKDIPIEAALVGGTWAHGGAP